MKVNTDRSRPATPERGFAALPVHAGKGYLVTGGARGVGRSTAEVLLAQGARVVIGDILADQLQRTAAELAGADGATDRILAVPFDLADFDSVENFVARAEEFLGTIDGVANVGAIVRHAEPLDVSRAEWQTMFDINLYGNYDVARLVANRMIAKGTRGAIVNVASEAGKVGHADSLAYSASKAALINATRMLSVSLAKADINVNCVCPGGLNTEMLREVADAYSEITEESADEMFGQMINSQLFRHIEPLEVARVISFLLTDDALIIRGQAINVDAGETPY